MAVQKSVKLGKFAQSQTGDLQGIISGLGIGSTEVFAVAATSQEGKPYLKLIADPHGVAYEVGAAFSKQKDGMIYYSVNLESPLFPAPLSAALFPDRDNGNMFNLIWNRPDAPKPSADVTATVNVNTTATRQPQGRRFTGAKPS